MRISDWSSDVCSSDLAQPARTVKFHVCERDRICQTIIQTWGPSPALTVSQIWSSIGCSSTLNKYMAHSTPKVISCSGWNRRSTSCSISQDLPTSDHQTSDYDKTSNNEIFAPCPTRLHSLNSNIERRTCKK